MSNNGEDRDRRESLPVSLPFLPVNRQTNHQPQRPSNARRPAGTNHASPNVPERNQRSARAKEPSHRATQAATVCQPSASAPPPASECFRSQQTEGRSRILFPHPAPRTNAKFEEWRTARPPIVWFELGAGRARWNIRRTVRRNETCRRPFLPGLTQQRATAEERSDIRRQTGILLEEEP